LRLVAALFIFLATAVHAVPADEPTALLARAIALACEPSLTLEQLAARLPESTGIADEPIVVRGAVVGWRRRLSWPDSHELIIERIAPRGQLRRLLAEYWSAVGADKRPLLAAVAGPRCEVQLGRRLLYNGKGLQALAIEHLDAKLAATGVQEPLNPPVPAGEDPGGVLVALIDAGVNYLLPEVSARLARDRRGHILGYDYWDMDNRPFDANPARSPFFPQRHGTKTASLLLHEAPTARLVPYRYPRPDMSRMTELVRDAAGKGVRVLNLSMGSNKLEDWRAFAAAAKEHADMLFIVSAGNDGRDIDAQPVYPAALRLDNVISVTSSEPDGELARGSNWGTHSVDLMVPAERITVTGFDGRQTLASGSSYAAVRVAALAARLLAQHPRWRAPQLKEAILARTLPPFAGEPAYVSQGFIPQPEQADAYPAVSRGAKLRELKRYEIKADELYDRHNGWAFTYALRPTFVYFDDTAWDANGLRSIAAKAAQILAQCGVYIPGIDVRVLGGPLSFRYFRESIGKELVQRIPLPKPTVYFVRDTLQKDAYDAEAIGKGNSATRPTLAYTLWITEAIKHPDIGLAHELTHILTDNGAHVERAGNLMRAETSPENLELTSAQCQQLVAAGRENALLTPLRPGR
jgi:Subtilase family